MRNRDRAQTFLVAIADRRQPHVWPCDPRIRESVKWDARGRLQVQETAKDEVAAYIHSITAHPRAMAGAWPWKKVRENWLAAKKTQPGFKFERQGARQEWSIGALSAERKAQLQRWGCIITSPMEPTPPTDEPIGLCSRSPLAEPSCVNSPTGWAEGCADELEPAVQDSRARSAQTATGREYESCMAELSLAQLSVRFESKKGSAALNAWLEDCGAEVFAEQLKEQDMTSLLVLGRLGHESTKELAAAVGMSKFMTEAFVRSCDELRAELQQLRQWIEIKKLRISLGKTDITINGSDKEVQRDDGPVGKKLKKQESDSVEDKQTAHPNHEKLKPTAEEATRRMVETVGCEKEEEEEAVGCEEEEEEAVGCEEEEEGQEGTVTVAGGDDQDESEDESDERLNTPNEPDGHAQPRGRKRQHPTD